jgi:hypothetical protein
MAQNTSRSGGSALDGRTARHPGYQLSQCKRKRIEEVFEMFKDGGNAAQDAASQRLQNLAGGAAYNLVRTRNPLMVVPSALVREEVCSDGRM